MTRVEEQGEKLLCFKVHETA